MLFSEIDAELGLNMTKRPFEELMKKLGVQRINRAEQWRRYRNSDYVVGSLRYGSKLRKWKAMGHLFAEDLECALCQRTWFDHQENPARCKKKRNPDNLSARYSRFTPKIVAKMLQRKLDGLSDTDVAREFNCSRSVIHRRTHADYLRLRETHEAN